MDDSQLSRKVFQLHLLAVLFAIIGNLDLGVSLDEEMQERFVLRYSNLLCVESQSSLENIWNIYDKRFIC